MQECNKGIVAGVDMGDKYCYIHVIDNQGEMVEETRIPTTNKALEDYFLRQPKMRIAVETVAHSPWVSRLLQTQGHEVLVANAREVRLIYAGERKTDKLDAEKLARLARLDPKLLAPIQHRSAKAQANLLKLRRL